jgi:hypothetical protein
MPSRAQTFIFGLPELLYSLVLCFTLQTFDFPSLTVKEIKKSHRILQLRIARLVDRFLL